MLIAAVFVVCIVLLIASFIAAGPLGTAWIIWCYLFDDTKEKAEAAWQAGEAERKKARFYARQELEAERQAVRSARLTEAGKVRVTCPSCGSRLSVPESTPADTDVRCPKCQQVFPKPPGQIAK